MNTEEIKRNTTMSDVLAMYSLKIGRNGMVKCPFHDDRRASLKVYNNRSFNCFACGTGGDVITFVMRLENVDFRTACERLGGKDEPMTEDVRRHISERKQEENERQAAVASAKWAYNEALDTLEYVKAIRDANEPSREEMNTAPENVPSDGALAWHAAACDQIPALENECDEKLDYLLALMEDGSEENFTEEATA